MTRDTNGECNINVGHNFDIHTEKGKYWDDYDFSLEHCKNPETSSCDTISKGFSRYCDRKCFLGDQFDDSFFFSIQTVYQSNSIYTNILLLDMRFKERHFVDSDQLYFRIAMKPTESVEYSDTKQSETFMVSNSYCTATKPVESIKELKMSELIEEKIKLNFIVNKFKNIAAERFNFVLDIDFEEKSDYFIKIQIDNLWAKNYRSKLEHQRINVRKGRLFVDGNDKFEKDLNKRLQQSKIGTVILTYNPSESQKSGYDYESYFAFKEGFCSAVPDMTSHSMHLTFSTSATIVLSSYSHPTLKPGKWHLSFVVNSTFFEELIGKGKDSNHHDEWQEFHVAFEQSKHGNLEIILVILFQAALPIIFFIFILITIVQLCPPQYSGWFQGFCEQLEGYAIVNWTQPQSSYVIFQLSIYLLLPLVSSIQGSLDKQSGGDLNVCYFNRKCFLPGFGNIPVNSIVSSLPQTIAGLFFFIFVTAYPIKSPTSLQDRRFSAVQRGDCDKRCRSLGLAMIFQGIFSCLHLSCPTKENQLFVQIFNIFLLNTACNVVFFSIVRKFKSEFFAKEASLSLIEGVLPAILLARFDNPSELGEGIMIFFVLLWNIPLLYRYHSFFQERSTRNLQEITCTGVLKGLLCSFLCNKDEERMLDPEKDELMDEKQRRAWKHDFRYMRRLSSCVIIPFIISLALIAYYVNAYSAVCLAYTINLLVSLAYLEYLRLKKAKKLTSRKYSDWSFLVIYGSILFLEGCSFYLYDFRSVSTGTVENSMGTHDFGASQSECMLPFVFLSSHD